MNNPLIGHNSNLISMERRGFQDYTSDSSSSKEQPTMINKNNPLLQEMAATQVGSFCNILMITILIFTGLFD